MKLTVPPENRALSKLTWPPEENLAPKLTVPPEKTVRDTACQDRTHGQVSGQMRTSGTGSAARLEAPAGVPQLAERPSRKRLVGIKPGAQRSRGLQFRLQFTTVWCRTGRTDQGC
jgi:hypothetical protein